MKTIIVECKKITDIESLYDELGVALDLPDYFGRNLDALWDCITGEIDLPVKVVLENFDNIKKFLDRDYINKLITLFKEAEEEMKDLFKVEYK